MSSFACATWDGRLRRYDPGTALLVHGREPLIVQYHMQRLGRRSAGSCNVWFEVEEELEGICRDESWSMALP